jgi:hypothetical protein
MLVNVVIVLATLRQAMADVGSGKITIDGMLLVKNATKSRNQNARKNGTVNNLMGASAPYFFCTSSQGTVYTVPINFCQIYFFNLHYIYNLIYYSCKEIEMTDFMTLGPVPFEEDCIQVSPEVDYSAMRKEVANYVALLESRFINIPENAYFGIKRESHDFGTYFEAAVYWDTENADSQAFACFVESRLPATWTDDSKLDWKTPVPAGWDVID